MKLDINFVALLCVLLTFIGFIGTIKYHEAKQKIKDENQCIKELVQSGVERKHIFTNQGKCYLESPL